MAKEESEFVAVACLAVGVGEKRRYIESGEVVDRAEFDKERFDKLLSHDSIRQRGKGDTIPGASSSKTTDKPMEDTVDRTGEPGSATRQKR